MWKFYGYYGGLNVVGNLNHYGQFSDDTTFELIPAWHNKLQAMALPFENIPYKNINAIGKHWIRQYALALTYGMLSQVRGKFSTMPIPGESITLNHGDLATLSANQMNSLKEELKTILDDMTYRALAEKDAAMVTAASTVLEDIPLLIYQG